MECYILYPYGKLLLLGLFRAARHSQIKRRRYGTYGRPAFHAGRAERGGTQAADLFLMYVTASGCMHAGPDGRPASARAKRPSFSVQGEWLSRVLGITGVGAAVLFPGFSARFGMFPLKNGARTGMMDRMKANRFFQRRSYGISGVIPQVAACNL